MLRATGYNKGAVLAQTSPHPRYHFHGYAGDQIIGDSKFFDRSGMGNHAVRGGGLSEAQMFANAGYVSTIDPIATNNVLRMPNLNFDHLGGETLIGYFLGKVTPEGSSQYFIGDGWNAANHGFALICPANGRPQLYMVDNAGGAWSGQAAGVAFDGTLHSVGWVLDGKNQKFAFWIDEVPDASYGAYSNYATGGKDTKNSNTFNIGQSESAAEASANGLATQTRAFHLLRLAPTDPIPSIPTMTNVFQQLRANPSKPILGGAF